MIEVTDPSNSQYPADGHSHVSDLLDQVYYQLIRTNDVDVIDTVSMLMDELLFCYDCAERSAWVEIIDFCRKHPLMSVLHQDPLTHRSFLKPRGYQGDAELLDMIYRRSFLEYGYSNVSQIGQAIFGVTIDGQAPSSVRTRLETLSKWLKQAINSYDSPCLLSVACGHMRELSPKYGIDIEPIGTWVGLDQDEKSLSVVCADYPSPKIQTIRGSISTVVAGRLTLDRFDIIYSTGLFDYLPDEVASRVIRSLSRMLHPKGKMLIANYRPGIPDAGYMEVFMDWQLIYRTEEMLRALLTDESEMSEFAVRTFRDESDHIVYLELSRNS